MIKSELKIEINELSEKSTELSFPKAKSIRDGVKIIMELLNGIDEQNLESYTVSYEALLEKSEKPLSLDELNSLIKQSTNYLDGLYELTEKVRDEQLSKLNLEYDKLFKDEIDIIMPINNSLFDLQKKYYALVKKLYSKKGL